MLAENGHAEGEHAWSGGGVRMQRLETCRGRGPVAGGGGRRGRHGAAGAGDGEGGGGEDEREDEARPGEAVRRAWEEAGQADDVVRPDRVGSHVLRPILAIDSTAR